VKIAAKHPDIAKGEKLRQHEIEVFGCDAVLLAQKRVKQIAETRGKIDVNRHDVFAAFLAQKV